MLSADTATLHIQVYFSSGKYVNDRLKKVVKTKAQQKDFIINLPLQIK